jgi:hypothetical protein
MQQSRHVIRCQHRGSAYLARVTTQIERDGAEGHQHDAYQGSGNGTGQLPDE